MLYILLFYVIFKINAHIHFNKFLLFHLFSYYIQLRSDCTMSCRAKVIKYSIELLITPAAGWTSRSCLSTEEQETQAADIYAWCHADRDIPPRENTGDLLIVLFIYLFIYLFNLVLYLWTSKKRGAYIQLIYGSFIVTTPIKYILCLNNMLTTVRFSPYKNEHIWIIYQEIPHYIYLSHRYKFPVWWVIVLFIKEIYRAYLLNVVVRQTIILRKIVKRNILKSGVDIWFFIITIELICYLTQKIKQVICLFKA